MSKTPTNDESMDLTVYEMLRSLAYPLAIRSRRRLTSLVNDLYVEYRCGKINLSKVDPTERPRYLTGVIVKHLRSRREREKTLKRGGGRVRELTEGLTMTDPDLGPAALAEAKEFRHDFRVALARTLRALRQMKDDHAKAFFYRFKKQLHFSEIGKKLRVSRATACNLFRYARARVWGDLRRDKRFDFTDAGG